MNKKLILSLGMSVLALVALASCRPVKHDHTYDGFSHDANQHWQVCTVDGCKAEQGRENHHGGTATETEKAVCEVCGESYGSLKEHIHAYTVSKVDAAYLASAADCDSAAVYYKSCACGEKGTETFTSGEALGHTYGEWTTKTPATCEDKEVEHRVCTVDGCDHEEVRDGDAALGHDMEIKYDANQHWTECKREGCDESTAKENHKGGIATQTEKAICSVCGQAYGELADHAHTFTKQIEDEAYLASEATCIADATYYYACTKEGCTSVGTDTWTKVGSKVEHTMGEWSAVGLDGYKTRTCTTDGCDEEESVFCLGSETAPISVDDAIDAMSAYESGDKSTATAYIKGVVVKLEAEYSGTGYFKIHIATASNSEDTLVVFRPAFSGLLSVGDEVLVSGNLELYDGVYEVTGGTVISAVHNGTCEVSYSIVDAEGNASTKATVTTIPSSVTCCTTIEFSVNPAAGYYAEVYVNDELVLPEDGNNYAIGAAGDTVIKIVTLVDEGLENPYDYTFESAMISKEGTITLDRLEWTVDATWKQSEYYGFDGNNDPSKGQQIGSSGNPATEVVLKTSGIEGEIGVIKVTTSGASSIAGTFTVTVGGTQVGETITLTKDSTEYTFDANGATGEIVLKWAQTSSKAIYIRNIHIEYEAACEHEYPTEWTVRTPATCTEAGEEYMVCTICGKGEKTQPIAAKGHNYEGQDYLLADPDTLGHYQECSVCGTASEVEEHTEGTAATETSKAVCSVCNKEYGETTAHVHVYDQEKALDAYVVTKETCEGVGVYNKSCSCGAKGTDTFEVAATGHAYGEWSAIQLDGTRSRTCANDSTHVETEEHLFGTAEAPLTVAQIIEAMAGFASGNVSTVPGYVKGYVVSSTYSAQYGNWTIDLVDDLTAENPVIFELYACANPAAEGDFVVATGTLKLYVNSSDVKTYEFDKGCTIVSATHNSTFTITSSVVDGEGNASTKATIAGLPSEAVTCCSKVEFTVTVESGYDVVVKVNGSAVTLDEGKHSFYAIENSTIEVVITEINENEVTFDVSKQQYTNGQAIESIIIDEYTTITFGKGTNTNNAPKYYTTGTALRMYKGNTWTVTSTKTIDYLIVTTVDNYEMKASADTSTAGTVGDNTITGINASEFTVNHIGDAQFRVITFTIAYAETCEHEYPTEWTERTPATCTEAGEEYMVCTICGAGEKTQPIAAKGHNYEGQDYLLADPDTLGHYQECSVCGTASEVEEHTEGTPATETSKAVCSVCNKAYGETTAHVHVYDQEKTDDAYVVTKETCEGVGIYNKSCLCGEKGTDTFEVAATGHSYGEWSAIQLDGTRSRTCANDSTHVETEEHLFGTAEAPLTVAQIREAMAGFASGNVSTVPGYVKGYVISSTYSAQYGNWTIDLVDDLTAENPVIFELYACANPAAEGDFVVATGKLKLYVSSSDVKTYEFDKGCTIVSATHNSTVTISSSIVDGEGNASTKATIAGLPSEAVTCCSKVEFTVTVESGYDVVVKVNGSAVTLDEGKHSFYAIENSTIEVVVTEIPKLESPYSYSFANKVMNDVGNYTLNGVQWNLAVTWKASPAFNYDTGSTARGQQIGTSSNPATSINLKTSGIPGKVGIIKINASGASSVNATLTVSVGGTQIGDAVKLTSKNAEYTFDANGASGEVVIKYTQTSSKALYIKSIYIEFAQESEEPTCEHTDTKLVDNGNGTHNVVCNSCNETVTENVTCTTTETATCTTPAKCECGSIVTPAGHKYVSQAEVPATCTEPGTEAHYTCEGCTKLFQKVGEDYVEVEASDLVIPASHDLEAQAEVPATCGEAGTKAHDKCSRCGLLFVEGEQVEAADLVIAATGEHDYKGVYTDPTFEADGYTTYTCSECGDHYVKTDEGSMKIATAIVGETKYETVAEAITAAPTEGKTEIKLLNDTTGIGLKTISGQEIVIDLNGKTYKIDQTYAGSAGTETNGLQILKGSKVTIKNGTLDLSSTTVSAAGKVLKVGIMNYGELVLDGVTMDASGNSYILYVVSNNCGSLSLTNGSVIKAAEGKAAFDLYYNLQGAYAEGVKVTVDSTSKVTGIIEYGVAVATENWEEKTILDLSAATAGNLDVTFAVSGTTNATIKLPQGIDCILNGEFHTHEYETSYNETHHYDACECGATKNEQAHTLSTSIGLDGYEASVCECGYSSKGTEFKFGSETSPKSVADSITLIEAIGGQTSTANAYVTGYVTYVKYYSSSNTYNLDIVDENGDTVVLNLYAAALAEGQDEPLIGDLIVAYGLYGTYNSKKQIQEGTIISVSHLEYPISSEVEYAEGITADVTVNVATKAKNGETVTFTLTGAEGYDVVVTLNDSKTLTSTDGVFNFVASISNNIKVVISKIETGQTSKTVTFTLDNSLTGDASSDLKNTDVMSKFASQDEVVKSCDSISKAYNGKEGTIKFSSKSANGYLYLTLNSTSIKVTKVIVSAIKYGSDAAKLSINGKSYTLTTSYADYVYEDSNGISTLKFNATKRLYITSVTIEYSLVGSEPTCEHTDTKLVDNGNGTHNVVCNSCDETVTENVTCTTTETATCTTPAKCECGSVVIAAGHKYVAHDEVPATCTEAGKEAHYTCEGCTSLFQKVGEDYVEVEASDLVIAATGEHDYKGVYTDPTFEADGYTTYTCSECGDHYVKTDEGSMKIATAIVGETKYETVAEAITAAPTEGTTEIKLLNDTTGIGLKTTTGQEIVIDLNGKTYKIDHTYAGSAGTETIGLQILKGSKVTIKNGTLDLSSTTVSAAGKVLKVGIMNYGELVLDGVTMDASGNSNILYVVSNNCGSLSLTNGSVIKAAEGKAAFDLYYNLQGAYAEGVKVTVDSTSKVTGIIEYGVAVATENWEEKTILDLSEATIGNLDVTFSVSGTTNATIKLPQGIDCILNGKFHTHEMEHDSYVLIDEVWYEVKKCTSHVDCTYSTNELTDVKISSSVGDVGYETLADAVANTNSSTTSIELLDNAEGVGLTAKDGQTVVIDLKGNTYKFDQAYAGSNGTETIGFQVLKGSKVIIKNGTLDLTSTTVSAAGKVLKVGIMNYGHLVLENVVLDASKNPNIQYVVSNNYGTLELNEKTQIIASAEGCAFDLWYGMFATYDDGVTVVVGKDAIVKGRIEYGAASRVTDTEWESKATLSLKDSTLANLDVTFVFTNTTNAEANIKLPNDGSVDCILNGKLHKHIALSSATCETDSVCSCGKVMEKAIGHSYVDEETYVAPTWTNEGYFVFTCSNEGCETPTTNVVIPSLNSESFYNYELIVSDDYKEAKYVATFVEASIRQYYVLRVPMTSNEVWTTFIEKVLDLSFDVSIKDYTGETYFVIATTTDSVEAANATYAENPGSTDKRLITIETNGNETLRFYENGKLHTFGTNEPYHLFSGSELVSEGEGTYTIYWGEDDCAYGSYTRTPFSSYTLLLDNVDVTSSSTVVEKSDENNNAEYIIENASVGSTIVIKGDEEVLIEFTVKYAGKHSIYVYNVDQVSIVPENGGKTVIYLTPGVWNAAGARYEAWIWGAGDAWVSFSDLNDDGTYEALVPEGTTGMKILRKGPSQASNTWDCWNNTGDITLNGNNKVTITGWDNSVKLSTI